MKKKFLALMLSLTMVMSMTACGGSDADTGDSSASASDTADEAVDETEPADESTDETEPADESTDETESADESADADQDAGDTELVDNEANGLKIALPADFTSADGGVEGMAAFTNADKNVFVTVTGPIANDGTAPDQLTKEVFTSIFQEGGYGDVAVDNVGTVEQPDGATAVTAFGTGTMPQDDGTMEANIVMQYYFMADGSGVYVINYVYPLDDTATDDVISDILASVTVE